MPWQQLLEGWVALLAPPRCPGCDLAGASAIPHFCGACAPLLEEAPASLAPPRPVAALHLYGGPLADAVRRLKYAGRDDLAAPLGALMARAAPAYAGLVDRVVPMPLHPLRLRERGFNQAALLGRPLARALGVPLDVDLVRRTRVTRAQAGLAVADRLANVRGAFAVGPGARGDRVLLVDDVRTSGATLAAAALDLRAAGFRSVYCLALAAAVG